MRGPFPDMEVFERKGLLGKWSAIAMLELQRIRFAGWALTKGQHRPKAGKKKKIRPKAAKKKQTREAGFFFLVPTSHAMFHREEG